MLASDDSTDPVFSTDDPRGHGLVEPERASDGEHPISDANFLGASQRRRSQSRRIDFQNSEVGFWVGTDDFGLDLASIAQFNGHYRGPGNDMIVGQNVAIILHDHATAGPPPFGLGHLSRRSEAALAAKEIF